MTINLFFHHQQTREIVDALDMSLEVELVNNFEYQAKNFKKLPEILKFLGKREHNH